MGWDSCHTWNSKADVKEGMVRRFTGDDTRVLASGGTGREFYLAVETVSSGVKQVVCCLIEGHGGEYWAKTIGEWDHPYYYDVPNKVLKAAGPPDPSNARALAWRAEVARRRELKDQVFEKGMAVTVFGRPYTIVHPKWTRTSATIRGADGQVYKAKIANIVPIGV